MAIVSLGQFKEMIAEALEYNPRRGRLTGDHMSAELFEGAGNTVHGLRVKFYLEDDGGTWDGTTIAKPTFIWDMLKISAGSIIDDGYKRADLLVHSASETDDGLYFYESNNSYLGVLSGEVQVSTAGLHLDKSVFNCWFTPYEYQQYIIGGLLGINSGQAPKVYISVRSDNAASGQDFSISVFIKASEGDVHKVVQGTSNMPLMWGKKYNLIVEFGGSTLRIRVNGVTLFEASYVDTTPAVGSEINFVVGYRFRGEISYMTLYANQWVLNETLKKAFFLQGYPLPRGPELVDLSDQFEIRGKNLLIDVNNIDKAIENFKGQLYVKTNTVKLRSE